VNERDSDRKVGQLLQLRPDPRPVAAEVASSSHLFVVLWEALADMLGAAAAATLLRRAAQRAATRLPELTELTITRQSLEYHYRVPASWKGSGPVPTDGIRELARELWKLLTDLTGGVVTGRLEQIPSLRGRGIIPPGPPRHGEQP
jgi:hypothetical protein